MPEGPDCAWEKMIREHPFARSIVPAWDEPLGWEPVRFGLYSSGSLVGGLVLGVRKAPVLPLFLGRVTSIMVDPAHADDMLRLLLMELHRYAAECRIVELELHLRFPVSTLSDDLTPPKGLWSLLDALGYRALNKVDRTFVVRIDRDDEALLGSFKPRVRRLISKARRSGAVVIREDGIGALFGLHDALVRMGRRKGVEDRGRDVVVDATWPLLSDGRAVLFSASVDGVQSNLQLMDATGVPCYVTGARTRANVNGSVPATGAFLHFEAMRFFRDCGHRWYDFGGCEGRSPVPGHPNYGVWHFKHGFEPAFVEFIPFFRRVIRPRWGGALEMVHRLRGDYLYGA